MSYDYTNFKKEISTDYYYVIYKNKEYLVDDFAKELFYSEKEFENSRYHKFTPSTISLLSNSIEINEGVKFSIELNLLHPLFETEKDIVLGYIDYLKLPKINLVVDKYEVLDGNLHINLKSYSVECPNYDVYYSNLYMRYHATLPEKKKEDVYKEEDLLYLFQERYGLKITEEQRNVLVEATKELNKENT